MDVHKLQSEIGSVIEACILEEVRKFQQSVRMANSMAIANGNFGGSQLYLQQCELATRGLGRAATRLREEFLEVGGLNQCDFANAIAGYEAAFDELHARFKQALQAVLPAVVNTAMHKPTYDEFLSDSAVVKQSQVAKLRAALNRQTYDRVPAPSIVLTGNGNTTVWGNGNTVKTIYHNSLNEQQLEQAKALIDELRRILTTEQSLTPNEIRDRQLSLDSVETLISSNLPSASRLRSSLEGIGAWVQGMANAESAGRMFQALIDSITS